MNYFARLIVLLLAGAFLWLSFIPGEDTCTKSKKKLAKELSGYEHKNLYGTDSSGQQKLNRIWEDKDGPCAITKIINDVNAKTKVRFFAAEVLLEKKDTIPSDITKKTLAEIYAKAIEKNVFGTLNYWGMFNTGNLGYSGEHLIKIGQEAVPYLAKLLDKEERLHFWGGKVKDEGARWGFRTKDVAAFYILKIRKQNFDWVEAAEIRDMLINDLKKTLKK